MSLVTVISAANAPRRQPSFAATISAANDTFFTKNTSFRALLARHHSGKKRTAAAASKDGRPNMLQRGIQRATPKNRGYSVPQHAVPRLWVSCRSEEHTSELHAIMRISH